ncbi:MAG: YgjV family protein [Ruminococcaceae bacterium]|nr:YgjV family protein [Oscillospiraceae bacterium]
MDTILTYFQQLTNANGVAWIIGQAFGIVAIILGFLNYQMRTQRKILFVQSATAAVFCIHYLLIGAYVGMALNFINIVRNLSYDYRIKKGVKSKIIPILFVVIQVAACALTWEAWYSVFAILGIGISTYCMSFSDSQSVRKSILVTSPLVLTYDIFARSVGGSIYETVAIISAIIGILQNRKKGNA